ncbi:MAG: 4Fe-4S binding protein, partial [Phycisphaerae bacterium]|nr:4Fe-4S binding protein [Phycisphaerae bacterium]
MNRGLLIILGIAVLFCSAGAVLAVQNFPPPDFESGYTLPETVVAPPQAAFYDVQDVLVLLVALSLAAWLALKKRSRNGLFVLMLFSLVYFGFWREGCICPIGAIQNVALALFDRSYTIPLTAVIFFLLPLLFTLFFGRVFCAAVCPLGAIQDAVLVKPVKVPGWLEGMVRLLAYLYLGAAVLFAATGSAFIICQYDPFVAIFRMSGSFDILVLGGSFLLIGLFVGRPYCRFFCPYGILLRLLSKFSRWRVSITPEACVQCRLCEQSCPYDAIQTPQEPRPLTNPFLDKLIFAGLLVLVPVLIFAGS